MLEKIDHINLTVSNLNESVKWYGKIFGFETVESGEAMGSPYAIIAYNDFMLCMYEEPNRKDAREIGDSSFHQIYHFGIRIKDQEQWRKVVKDNNLKLKYGGEISYPRSTSWYIQDPSGHAIEVSYSEKGLWR